MSRRASIPLFAAMLLIASPRFGLAQPLDVTPGYPEVQRAFLQEEFVMATHLAESFLLQSPEAPEASRVWLWLILSHDRLQQSGEALHDVDQLKRRIPSKDPLWPEVLFWEGDISRRAMQMPRAKAAFGRLLKQYPDSTWAAQGELGLGLIEFHHQAFEAAIPYFRGVANRGGDPAAVHDARMFEGICQLQLKRRQEAIAIFERLLAQVKDPNMIAQAAFYLGESYSGIQQYADAAASYGWAVEASGKGSQWRRPAQFGLAWSHFRADQCEQSVKAFTEYLSWPAVDHRTEALFSQGSCLVKLGRENEAVASFEEIISRDPEHPLALESAFVVADAYRRDGRFAQAKELMHQFLRRKLSPTGRAQIQLRLGSIALEQGNAAQARTVFTLATEDPNPAIQQSAYSGLGDVHLFFGNVAEAQAWYEKAAKRAEKTSVADHAAFQLGRIHLQLGQLDEAQAAFRRLASKPDSPFADDARLALVITYLNQKKEAEARGVLQAIQREQPGSVIAARAGYYQALLALAKEDFDEAKRLCTALITRAPSTDEAFEARLLLADLQAHDISPKAAMSNLKRLYEEGRLPLSQRAKVAKRIGDLLRDQGRYPDAIRWYEEALDILPAVRGEALYRMASCYEEAGDFELAITWYRKVEQAPWRVRGMLAAAKLLERLERDSEARAIYEEVAKEPVPEAKLIRERLAAGRGR